MIKKLFEKHRELILYIIMGVLTTLVYFVSFFTADKVFEDLTATIIAHFFAITFAFAVNKYFVFRSKSESSKGFIREVYLFYSARTLSILIDLLITGIFIKWKGDFFAEKLGLTSMDYSKTFFHLPIIKSIASDAITLNKFIFKTIGQVLILIANYLFSKFIIFKKPQK